jgi:protein TonB
MLISNFNLYKTEWLDLVFDNRNKAYGAFQIRQHYADNVVRAMVITFVSAVSLALIVGKLISEKPAIEKWTEFKNDPVYVAPPPAAPKKIEPPKPKTEAPTSAPKAAELAKTVAFPPPIVTADPESSDLPVIDDHTNVGQTTVSTGSDVAPIGGGGGEGGTGTASTGVEGGDIDANPMLSPEKMPEPMNGMQGWTKFLQNTIRYPGAAISNGVSGRVIVSFIVEKDGQLTNFKIERGPGSGLNEEAIRVLKLAKPWKPGMQNGRPVRVKLTLPIAFSLEEN